MNLRELARLYPVSARLVWLGDNLTSRGRNPDMVNEWTRDDLPDHVAIRDVDYMHGDGTRPRGIDLTLDMVVGHLNANHPKLDADRWRRAHEIVEQERDQARASLHEACKVAQSYKVDAYQATERAEAAERELDEWKSRAEAAEARTAPAVSRADVAEALSRCINPEWWNVTFPRVVSEVCDLFGVEAGQATDPVEEKAAELWEVARPSDDVMWRDLTSEAQQEYRRIAAHVLGQEAGQ